MMSWIDQAVLGLMVVLIFNELRKIRKLLEDTQA